MNGRFFPDDFIEAKTAAGHLIPIGFQEIAGKHYNDDSSRCCQYPGFSKGRSGRSPHIRDRGDIQDGLFTRCSFGLLL
jgi:hypothetical protein